MVVKHYPGTLEEYTAKVWDEEYSWYTDYNRNVYGYDETGKQVKLAGEALIKEARKWADNATPRKVRDEYNAPCLYIEYQDGGVRRLIQQKISVKSKEITAEYISKLIAKDKKAYSGAFGRFADAMNKLMTAAGVSRNGSVYPTTYGIGVWVFYNYRASETIADIEAILRANGVEYYNEFSNARWVYRFKISKKQANINLALTAK